MDRVIRKGSCNHVTQLPYNREDYSISLFSLFIKCLLIFPNDNLISATLSARIPIRNVNIPARKNMVTVGVILPEYAMVLIDQTKLRHKRQRLTGAKTFRGLKSEIILTISRINFAPSIDTLILLQ